jgi:hypothetical protein
MKIQHIILLSFLLLLIGCSQPVHESVSRYSKIPSTAVKMTPDTDFSPLNSYTTEYDNPVPISVIDSAGAEDSAFIMPDGNTLYVFFTPDVSVPVEKQILDGVTGIYLSHKTGGVWSDPERIVLQDDGKLAMDGCEFVLGSKMWFCTVREGYTGIHWFSAEFRDGRWQDWKNADFNPDYMVGELHITGDGKELYYHSDRPGGKGGLDIWVSEKVDGVWQEPKNVDEVNTNRSEGWPAILPDGNELWITRDYGLWRSKKVDGRWSEPVLMFSPLAGEASIDNEGNVYFTHHFYKDDKMIEADIYFAKKK